MTLDFFLLQKLNSLAFHWPWLDSLIVFLAKRLPYLLAASVFLLPFFCHSGLRLRQLAERGEASSASNKKTLSPQGGRSLGRFLTRDIFKIKYWRVALESFLAAGLGLGIARLIRYFWLRPRPLFSEGVNSLIGHQVRSGFPSVHATFFFALSAVLVFYNKKIGALFFALSGLIVLSRVIAGLHWPSDIAAGLALGVLCGLLVPQLLKKYFWPRVEAKR